MSGVARYFDKRFKVYKSIGYNDEQAFGWALFDMGEYKNVQKER